MEKRIDDVDISGIAFERRSKRKMKAFSKNQDGKYQFVGGDQVGNRRSKKNQVKNANRSLKKSKRQELKNELVEMLEES